MCSSLRSRSGLQPVAPRISLAVRMSDKESQRDELTALESIYNKEEFHVIEEDDLGGNFFAFVKVPQDFKVLFRNLRKEASVVQTITVQYLPPLCLHFTLPKDYPSVSPPVYKLSCSWLNSSQLRRLCKNLNMLWKEHKGTEILYMWMQYLVEESLNSLQIQDMLDVSILETQHLRLKENNEQQMLESKTKASSQMQQQEKNPLKQSGTHKRSDHRHQLKDRNRNERQRYQSSTKQKYSEKQHSHLPESVADEVQTGTEKNKVKYNLHRHAQERRQARFNRERTLYSRNGCQKNAIGKYHRQWTFTNVEYSVMQLIQNFDAAQQHVEFLRNMHTCTICFEDKIGSDCTRFKDCGHAFCKACICDYFTVRIKDGTVHTILCPADKCTVEATPTQIREIVTPELYARYDSVLLNSLLDTMEDTYYCPRQFCQYPVAVEEGESMAICPSCNYVFCVYCKRVYHGVEPCKFKNDEKQRLIEEYSGGDETRRKFLEKRYGKQQLETLVNTSLSEKWLSTNSKKCPNCNAAIEKMDGCNKMLCWKCNTRFCWLCQKALNAEQPYEHFNNPDSKCFGMLFYGVSDDSDDGWDDWLNQPDSEDSEEDEMYLQDEDY